jgi:hypothetical protein
MRLLACCMVHVVFLAATAACCQDLSVQIVDGRNGQPMNKFRVYIILDDPKDASALSLLTGRDGEIRFDPGNAKTLQVRPVGAVECSPPTIAAYGHNSIEEIRKTGLVGLNYCGRANMKPLPGRLVIYARPATWWELFKN